MKSIFSLLIAISLLAFPAVVTAQSSSTPTTGTSTTTTASQPGFTPASYAVYIHENGQAVAASLTDESFNLTPNFGVVASEELAPTINLQAYLAGASYVLPLDNLFTKTTLANNAPTMTIVGSGGEVLNTTTGSATTKPSFLLRGILAFNLGSGVTTPISVGYQYMPGFGAGNNGFLITAGLAKTFGLP